MSREIKYMAWDTDMREMVSVSGIQFDAHSPKEKPNIIDQHNDIRDLDEVELFQYIGKKDIDGNEIYADSSIVIFKLLTQLHESVLLRGVFTYNEDELRYEIDIYGNPDYTCLSYISNGQMYDFEIIGTAQQNPELLK